MQAYEHIGRQTLKNRNLASGIHSAASACTYFLLFCMSAFACLVAFSGRNQQISPTHIERRLRLGMTDKDIINYLGCGNRGLNLKAISSDRPSETAYCMNVSSSGIGSCFCAQHEITLVFDENRRLTGGYDKEVYLCDDSITNLQLVR